MFILVIIGVLLSLAGLAGILWCIRVAARLRRSDLSDEATRAEIGRLAIIHMAALGSAFIGLGLLVVGLVLQ